MCEEEKGASHPRQLMLLLLAVVVFSVGFLDLFYSLILAYAYWLDNKCVGRSLSVCGVYITKKKCVSFWVMNECVFLWRNAYGNKESPKVGDRRLMENVVF